MMVVLTRCAHFLFLFFLFQMSRRTLLLISTYMTLLKAKVRVLLIIVIERRVSLGLVWLSFLQGILSGKLLSLHLFLRGLISGQIENL